MNASHEVGRRRPFGKGCEGLLKAGTLRAGSCYAAGVAHFDGEGNLTWVEHTVVNGTLLQLGFLEASGTYAVNPDCTGTAVVNTPNSPVPLKFGFAVVRHGTEVHTILDSDAVSAAFIKVE